MNCLVNAVIPANQYTLAPNIQEQLVDKVTGLPLSAGVIYFYRDLDHTALKSIYTISGPPDAPIFTALPNPLTLSSAGTFIDPTNNQDIIPYFLPFDQDGNIDLYYIEVYNSMGVLQFTRDHFPTVNEESGNLITLTDNFLPNGQFLGHLNLINNGAITNPTTPIAYGNWTFEVDSDFTSTNFITFSRFNAPTDNPAANPRYAVTASCTVPNAAETRKDICNTITDVNFMQNQIGVVQFSGISNTTSPVNVTVLIRKNFGTGGTATTETVIGNIVVQPDAYLDYNIPFRMSDNTGQTLGPNDDDYLQVVLRFDTGATFNVSLTDFIYAAGTFTNLFYPPVSPEQDKSFWVTASFLTPAHDGSDNNLFVQLQTTINHGNTELCFAYASPLPVGTHEWYTGATAPTGYLLEDGSSYAVSNDVNNTVTAYTSLFGVCGYAYGTGQNGFRNASVSSTQMSATWNRDDVAQTAPDAGTSGFTLTVHTAGTIGVYQVVYVTPLAGSAITPGTYYRLIVNTSGPQFIQMFWFTVDGVGTIPTGITYNVSKVINIASTDTAAQVTTKLISGANGLFQVPFVNGVFIRGWSNGTGRDGDAATRTGSGYAGSGNIGDNIGSFQQNAIVNHTHQVGISGSGSSIPEGTGPATPIFTIQGSGNTGGISLVIGNSAISNNETHPTNIYFNGIIKY